jgi:cytochrome P450
MSRAGGLAAHQWARPRSRKATAGAMPPGPPLPRVVQTAGFIFAGPRFLEACRRRYGDAVTFATLFDSRFVIVFDPALVKELFQGSGEQLHAGEANSLLGPVLGDRSVLLLDESEHLRHRRLMLPPFHGLRMQAYAHTMLESSDLEIDSWPVGQPFALMPSMQSLTLRVIMRTVFGLGPGPAEERLRARVRAMVEPLARPRGLMMLARLSRLRRRRRRQSSAALEFRANRRAVDEILYEEIGRRRGDPNLDQRDDVFSGLVLARDENGEPLTDREIRDELVTLLLAGHETTATGLSWTFDMLLHTPSALARATDGDPAYLDAVVKESLRIRPVIAGVGRVVSGEPFRLGDYVIPPGIEINPSIRAIHRRPDLYPEPTAFRPERFLGEGAPDTYTWIPFGGGTRRCLGASFALMEMRIVLARVLERCALRAANPELAKAHFRAITIAPQDGVMVEQERPPRPPPVSAGEAAVDREPAPAGGAAVAT